MQAIAQIVALGAGGVTTSIGAVKSLGFVPEGHVGVKLRWGKVVHYSYNKYDRKSNKLHSMGDVIYYGPGWRWIIPYTHKFRTVSLLEQVMDLPGHEILLADNMIFEISAVINFRVVENIAYKALYKVDDYKDALNKLCITELRELLAEQTHDELRLAKVINQALFEAVHDIAYEKWGIKVLSFRLKETKPDEHTKALIQLEQAVQMRVNLLQKHIQATAGIDVAMASVLLGSGTLISSSPSSSPRSGTENGGKISYLEAVPEQPFPA